MLGYPFTISTQEALSVFRAALRRRPFSPQNCAGNPEIFEVFVPIWVFRATARTTYQCAIASPFSGTHLDHNDQMERVPRARLLQRSGIRKTHFDWRKHSVASIPASYAIAGVSLDSILGDMPGEPLQLSAADIDGRKSLETEVKAQMAHRLMKDTVVHQNMYSIKPWLKKKYKCDIISMLKIHNNTVSVAECSLIHFPVFLINYEMHGQPHSSIVAGNGDKLWVSRHYSVAAMTGGAVGVGAATAALFGSVETTLVTSGLAGFLLYSHATNSQFLLHLGQLMNKRHESDLEADELLKRRKIGSQHARANWKAGPESWADNEQQHGRGDKQQSKQQQQQQQSFGDGDPRNEQAVHLKTMNLPPTKRATQAEIRKAYLTLVKRWHPDQVKESERVEAEIRFKQVSAAYTFLKEASPE